MKNDEFYRLYPRTDWGAEDLKSDYGFHPGVLVRVDDNHQDEDNVTVWDTYHDAVYIPVHTDTYEMREEFIPELDRDYEIQARVRRSDLEDVNIENGSIVTVNGVSINWDSNTVSYSIESDGRHVTFDSRLVHLLEVTDAAPAMQEWRFKRSQVASIELCKARSASSKATFYDVKVFLDLKSSTPKQELTFNSEEAASAAFKNIVDSMSSDERMVVFGRKAVKLRLISQALTDDEGWTTLFLDLQASCPKIKVMVDDAEAEILDGVFSGYISSLS